MIVVLTVVSVIAILVLICVVGLFVLPYETTSSSGVITYYANNSTAIR
jgi:hypothetical protein